jgi:predicted phage terminase large subunit-like protein
MKQITSPSDVALFQYKMVSSFEFYVNYSYPGFLCGPHHSLIIDALSRLESREISRLIISMPPRHGKSLLGSELFPCWYLGRNPTHEAMAVTYSQERANDAGRKVRNRMQSPLFRAIFPSGGISRDSEAKNRFDLVSGGAYYGVGVNGPITGRGGNLISVDDPIKNRAEAESETIRASIKAWYQDDLYTRLMPNAVIAVFMTRWHEDDLAGWLLSEHQHEGWHVLSLPALAEENDPLGREYGEALWPQAFPRRRLLEIKESLGSRGWNSLYQQRPAPEEGGIFLRSWVKRYDEPPHLLRRIASWDTATSEKDAAAWSVGQIWGESLDGYYLLDQVRGRWEFPELLAAVKAQYAKWKPSAVLIEDKSSGRQVAQSIKRESTMPVIPINPPPGHGKVVRARIVSPTVEAGNVYLPNKAGWLTDLEGELFAFPNARYADQVDALTQALEYMSKRSISDGMDLS